MIALEFSQESAFREVPLADIECADNRRLLSLWSELAGDRLAPAWREVDMLALPAAYIPRLIVVDVLPDEDDFKYRFFGTWHTDCHKHEMTGKRLSDYPDTAYAAEIASGYRTVVERRKPVLFRYDLMLQNVRYLGELIRLPLSDDGQTVSGVIVGEALLDEP